MVLRKLFSNREGAECGRKDEKDQEARSRGLSNGPVSRIGIGFHPTNRCLRT